MRCPSGFRFSIILQSEADRNALACTVRFVQEEYLENVTMLELQLSSRKIGSSESDECSRVRLLVVFGRFGILFRLDGCQVAEAQ